MPQKWSVLCDERLSKKTSQGEFKGHYLIAGEATYPNVVPRLPVHGAGEDFSLGEELRPCGSSWFSCPGLVPQASSTSLLVLPTTSTNPVEAEKGLLWSAVLTWLSARLNLLPIQLVPSPWYLLQRKPSVLQHFYLSLGRQMKQSNCDACGLMMWSSSSCILHTNLVLTV